RRCSASSRSRRATMHTAPEPGQPRLSRATATSAAVRPRLYALAHNSVGDEEAQPIEVAVVADGRASADEGAQELERSPPTACPPYTQEAPPTHRRRWSPRSRKGFRRRRTPFAHPQPAPGGA